MSTFIDSCMIYVCLQTVHVLEKIVEEKLKKLSALGFQSSHSVSDDCVFMRF